MSEFLQRMLIERYELFDKELKARSFLDSAESKTILDTEDREMLNKQVDHMTAYRLVLEERIATAERKRTYEPKNPVPPSKMFW